MTGAPRLPRRDEIDAVLLDVDGTLYRPGPVKRAMALRLLAAPLTGPWTPPFWAAWRIVWTFRRHREALREASPGTGLEERQYADVARVLGRDVDEVRAVVRRWILEAPLPVLRRLALPGLEELFRVLHGAGLRLGLLSDYPPAEKARALGVPMELVDAALCSTDGGIDVFKPHPLPFEEGARRLGLPPDRVLYVGDRPDMDGEGARRAGMPCAIVTWGREAGTADFPPIASPLDLTALVEGTRDG